MVEIIENYLNGKTRYKLIYNDYNQLHNDNGPSKISYLNDGKTIYREEYFINDRRHREDGPAWIEYTNNGNAISKRTLYFYNNIQLSVNKLEFEYEEFLLKINRSKRLSKFYANKILINMANNLTKEQKQELHDLNDSKIILETLERIQL